MNDFISNGIFELHCLQRFNWKGFSFEILLSMNRLIRVIEVKIK